MVTSPVTVVTSPVTAVSKYKLVTAGVWPSATETQISDTHVTWEGLKFLTKHKLECNSVEVEFD